jgi:hypothetical protein
MSDTHGSSSGGSTGGGGSNGGRRLAVYAITEREGERAWWQKIGLAFTNRDGSIAIYLDALPIGTNKLQVREQREEPAARAAPGDAGGGASAVEPASPRRNGAAGPTGAVAGRGEEARS